jgi:DNA (cytosine-5)-methyltransferase 1
MPRFTQRFNDLKGYLMRRLLLLDVFCGAGGASWGYVQAGFDVVGVDHLPQPNFPFDFIKADALEYIALHGYRYDAIHASPPCQKWTEAQHFQRREHPDLITPLRPLLRSTGKPYVIENVPNAPLKQPVLLCGRMFDLNLYRHRLFESNIPLDQPVHPKHHQRVVPVGRPWQDGDVTAIVGHFSNVQAARRVMGIEWMNRDELAQAIPPAYATFIGKQLLEVLV